MFVCVLIEQSALRRKHVLLFVLCMEFPLVLTNAEYVNRVRDDDAASVAPARRSSDAHEAANGSWELYDHKQLAQHWVACKRQLEQLLGLLFRWKTKRRGRDVLVLSGGVRVGLDTLVHETSRDKDTGAGGDALSLSLRNLTCGPVTASVEPFGLPLSGVACPTFGGGAKDERFTFAHRVVSANNYVLVQLAVSPDPLASRDDSSSDPAALSATVTAAFVVPSELDAKHPVGKCQRFPSWWRESVLTRSDSVQLETESNADVLALRQFVDADKSFAAAIELFYEKHQFAETARMAELRSAGHAAQHFDLQRSLRAVFADVWKALPASTRQQLACLLDPFVVKLLLGLVAPTLLPTNEDVKDPPFPNKPVELAFFCGLCRDVVVSAGVLRLSVRSQRAAAAAARELAKQEERERAAREALASEQLKVALADEDARLAQLLRTDPAQYATQALARETALKEQRDVRGRDRLERKRAERVRELEEERAIAKENKALDRLAETDPSAYERRQSLLETRVRSLREAKAQRAAAKERKKQQLMQQQEEEKEEDEDA